MKKFINYSLLMFLFSFIAFACSKEDGDVGPLSAIGEADASINFGNRGGGYILTDAIDEGDNTWSFTIKQTGDSRGIGLSHLVIGYVYCPTEEHSGSTGIEFAEIENGATYNPDILYTFGGGTECADNTFLNGFFKLDNLTSLVKDKEYTVRFTFAQDMPEIDYFVVYIKAGNFCGPVTINASDCDNGGSCSFSKGYYFARPFSTWMGKSITLGGHNYSEAEGDAIWDAKVSGQTAGDRNKTKQIFTQAATAILNKELNYLSTADYNSNFKPYVEIIDTYLSGFSKITPSNIPYGENSSGVSLEAAFSAASSISNEICKSHCGTAANPNCTE